MNQQERNSVLFGWCCIKAAYYEKLVPLTDAALQRAAMNDYTQKHVAMNEVIVKCVASCKLCRLESQ